MSAGLRGSLGDFPLRTILRLFTDTKKTGELQIRQGDRVGALGLADGRVVCAVYGEEPAIVALGEIFTLDGAEFEFTAWDEAPPANLEGELDDLLRKAEDHRKWISSVREVIPNDGVRFRLSERAAQQGAVTFTSDRWRVVLAVNGERDVIALAETLHIDRDAALTTLAGLVRDGVIEVVPTEATEPPKQAAAPVVAAPVVKEPPPVVAAPEPVKEPEPPKREATPVEPTPPSFETTPQWGAPAAMAPAPPVREPEPVLEPTPPPAPPTADWGPPAPAPTPEPPGSTEDRLAALSGIFGPAPTAESTPAGDPWAAPAPAPAPDQWSAPPATSAPNEWSAPAATDQWSAPPAAPAAEQWAAPGAAPASEWATPAADDPRLAAFAMPAPAAPEAPPEPKHAAPAAVDEWAAPPAEAVPAAPEKKRGLFGFGRKEKTPAAAPATVAVGPVSRPAMLAALSNAMITEYNSGRYGKNTVETRMANLLMRVDEQADPIDKPLPIVDERIDVQALDRARTPSDQIAPYLALLVGTIYAEAEKLFGRDKAKKGYKAAMVSALGSDSVALATPELAGKLPKV